MNLPAIQAKLAANSVADTNEALQSRASSRGIDLIIRGDVVKTDRIGMRRSIKEIIIRGGDVASLEALADDYRKSMTGPDKRQVEEWLAELSVIVAQAATDEFTVRLKVNAYTKRLIDYPADVVREALTVVRWKFWPSWEELADTCDRLCGERRAVLRRIEEAARKRAATKQHVTPEDAAARKANADRIMEGFMEGKPQ